MSLNRRKKFILRNGHLRVISHSAHSSDFFEELPFCDYFGFNARQLQFPGLYFNPAYHVFTKLGDTKVMGWELAASGYAGVWATENTREAIWDAMKRKEVYATTGATLGRTANPFSSLFLSADANIGGKVLAGDVVRLKGYTVATLPAGTQGDTAFVTDATAPTYLGTLTGGGAVVTPVFYNGTAWVSH